MNSDQKTGMLIVVISVTLMAVTLALSKGWGVPGATLYLFQFEYGRMSFFALESRYVVAILLLGVGYGIARFFSLISPIFRKR